MKLFKNFFITIKTKGFVTAMLAIKNFFIILLVKFFSSSVLIKKKVFNYKMFLDPGDKGISRTLLLFGERELDHKIILEKVLKKNMKIFDIGANIGYYVLMETKIVGDKGKIVAIEPVPLNMKLLKKNLELNNNKITKTIQVALSSYNKKNSSKESFVLSSHSNLGRLIRKNEININKKKIIENLNKEKKKIIKINTMNIKELIQKTFLPDFIRMDIEGKETDILDELASLKLKKYPIICFETHTSQYKKNQGKRNMEKTLRKIFQRGYKTKYASTSYEKGSIQLKKLGYKPYYSNIKTDDVTREIYKDLKKQDVIDLICYQGGLRTILMFPQN